MTSKRGGVDLAADMRWARTQLLAGREVWCVRGRGLVVMFITASPEDWRRFEQWCINREDGQPFISGLEKLDAPLDNYTLTPVRLMDDGEPHFGVEKPWPGSPGHHAQHRELERGLRGMECVGQINRLSDGH